MLLPISIDRKTHVVKLSFTVMGKLDYKISHVLFFNTFSRLRESHNDIFETASL